MCDTAVKIGGYGEYSFGEDKPDAGNGRPPEPGADPADSIVAADYLEAERAALAACEHKQQVEVGRDAYLARVRSSMRSYSSQLMDGGYIESARHVLQELQRLDSLHNFKAYDPQFADVVKPKGQEYREHQWKPSESAPTVDELGTMI